MLIIDDLNIALDISEGRLVYYSFDSNTGQVDFDKFGEVTQDDPAKVKITLVELANKIKTKEN